MFTQRSYYAMAAVINRQLDSVMNKYGQSPYAMGDSRKDLEFKAAWHTVFDTAIDIARTYHADNERFNAEKFFAACGFGDQRIQEATNKIGALTKADVQALRAAVNR
jgi:hypothetical protein